MPKVRTPQTLGKLAAKRLAKVYLDGNNWIHVDKHQVPFSEWLLYWLAQPLTLDNPVSIWDDMDSDAELAHYGYESGDGEDAELVNEIFVECGVHPPAEWYKWDGMGEPAWLGT